MDRISKVTVAVAAAVLVVGVCAWAEEGNAPKAGEGGKGKGARPNPEAVFQKMDANNDGIVTKDEFIANHEAHAKAAGREAPPKEEIEKRFAAMDTNGDGQLTKDEFSAGFAKGRGGHGKRGHGAGAGDKPEQGAK